ncbi:putative barnase/colicin E5 family endoribonuclease [Helicobacter bizzozeronii]|uniref:putative barnase/colicin E5 family endoribonuclease n=1 Tax=Helicobacter bizzozeronii TaxID=56877 RepID=UPI0018F7F428|nr:PBECR2 nuclease fold domain-containing protein [Helicobacter bizzozeronii]
MLNLKLKNNATKALIREIEGGLPPDDGGGGIANPHLGDSGGKPPSGGEPPPTGARGEEPKRLSFEEIKALIDSSPSKGRDMVIIGRVNFSPAVVDYLLEFKEPSKKIAIEHLEPSKAQELGFKYPTDVRRTIDKSEILHVLERHGENGTIKQAREQPAVTKEDIAKYPQYTDQADFQVLGSNHAGEVIISGKQINGYYVVVEQIRKGQNELAFKTMYFERGDLHRNPVFDSVMPKEHPKHPSYELGLGQTTDTKTNPNSTTQELKNQATELHAKAKEQEAGFKELLEGLKGSSTLEANNTLKSLQSIQEKLEYYKGDTGRIDDLLRGAVLADRQAFDAEFMRVLGSLEANPKTTNITPKFIKTQDGYTGAHINFNFNGIPAEIQVHTPKSWAVKKQLDPLYKEKRRLYLEGKLSNKDIKEFKRKMKAIGQESDLDSSLFTSSKLISPQAPSTMSVLAKKSGTDLKDTQEPLLKSNSNPGTSESGTAYNRLDSKLNQKSTSLTGGKGIDSDIQAPLAQDSTQGLKDKPLLLTYKNTQELVTHAKAEGLSPARIGQLVQERKQAIAGLLPYKREVDINRVIFKEDIKNSTQIVLEGRQAYLSHAQLLQALNKAKELKNNSPSIYELVQHHQSRLAQLQDRTLAYEWLKAFNLKSLDEPFIPQFSKEVQEALEPVLKGEQIKLTRGSLAKLEKRQRDSLLPHIKPALEQSDMILRDKENVLIFVKGIEKTYYFTSVARSGDGSWTIRTNSYKTLNRLKNVVGDGGEVLHVGEKAPNILAETFKAKTFFNQLVDNSSTTSLNPPTKPPLKSPNIEPNPAFGEHFKEFEGKGAQAVAKLLKEKRGQVAGAFYREDLGESGGYIDLVWGASATDLKGLKGANGKPLKPYGLSKIVEKHLDDFKGFEGANALEKLGNGIEAIIRNGEVLKTHNGYNILYRGYKVGLNEGWNEGGVKKGSNRWVVTAYDNSKSLEEKNQGRNSDSFTKGETLPLNPKDNSSTTPLKPKKSKTPPLEIEGEHYFGYDNTHPQFKGIYGVLRLFKDKDHGEVSRVFTRPDLGDIDLVWGKQKGLQGGKVVDIGLSRIHRKLKDFADFPGTFANKKEIKAASALTTIITQGIHLEEEGTNMLWLKSGPNYHGLSLALRNSERRAWIVTDHIKTQTPPQALKGYESALDLDPEWAKAFGLKDNQATFSVYLSPKVAKALIDPKKAAEAKALGVQNVVGIELSPHTLFKIEAPNKEAFLPYIRQTLEEPDLLIKNQGLLFLKEFKDPKTGKDFISLAQSGHIGWHFSQHSPQELEAFLKEQIQQGQIAYNGLKNKTPNIEPNPAFGEHFKEFEGKGAQAVAKLLQEKRGQVAGAFYREDLGESGGYIDLVWGASATDLKGLKGANGKPLKPYGLSKIVEKHLDDFKGFEGANALEKLGNGIETIIKNGNLVNDQAGVKTFILKDNGREFRVGISQGWEHEGKNYWIITAYENKKTPPAQKFDQVAAKSEHGSDLAQKGETNSTKPPLKTPKIEPNPEDFNYTTEGIKGLKELREDLKQALSPILNQDIKNKETGVIARLSSTGLNKISSSKALEKSIANGFSKEEHFKVGAGIKSLFENATLKETYADKKASPDIKAMHRYFTRLNVNGKPAEAKITLKESVQKGHRIYSLELEELSPLP